MSDARLPGYAVCVSLPFNFFSFDNRRDGQRMLRGKAAPYPPITATPWISISIPGRAKFETVIKALAG
jgi:hypothetical protein